LVVSCKWQTYSFMIVVGWCGFVSPIVVHQFKELQLPLRIQLDPRCCRKPPGRSVAEAALKLKLKMVPLTGLADTSVKPLDRRECRSDGQCFL
jgi:hypothetical protein